MQDNAATVAGPWCNCPIDWIACFKRDCPRAAVHHRQREQNARRIQHLQETIK